MATETPRGLLVAALRASSRRVYSINPMGVARYRERHSVSRKKSDHADCRAPPAAHDAMAANSSSATRPAEETRTSPRPPTPVSTAPRLPGPGTGCPAADPPHRLDRPARPTADHRRHRDPADRRPAALRRHRETRLALVAPTRRHHRRDRRALAGVPAPLRHRTRLPHAQTNSRLDQPETARPPRRRPLDLAGTGRLHRATPRARRRLRPPPALGTPGTT